MVNKKRRRGYTLMELIVVLGILSIITLICYPTIKVYEDSRLNMDTEYAVEGVIEFINCGKAYARNKKSAVSIRVLDNRLVMISGSKNINEFIYSEVVRELQIPGKVIEINSNGQITTATTITLIFRTGETQNITAKAVTSYVSRQK